MKKIAFMFAVATMFVACGGNGNQPAQEEATDSIETVQEADTLAADTLAADTL